MCTDTCIVMCIDMNMDNVYRHGYEPVYGHVYGHVHRHVYGQCVLQTMCIDKHWPCATHRWNDILVMSGILVISTDKHWPCATHRWKALAKKRPLRVPARPCPRARHAVGGADMDHRHAVGDADAGRDLANCKCSRLNRMACGLCPMAYRQMDDGRSMDLFLTNDRRMPTANAHGLSPWHMDRGALAYGRWHTARSLWPTHQ